MATFPRGKHTVGNAFANSAVLLQWEFAAYWAHAANSYCSEIVTNNHCVLNHVLLPLSLENTWPPSLAANIPLEILLLTLIIIVAIIIVVNIWIHSSATRWVCQSQFQKKNTHAHTHTNTHTHRHTDTQSHRHLHAFSRTHTHTYTQWDCSH